MIIKHKTVAVLSAAAFALSATPALAGPHADAPGTPGEANCMGQTTAFFAQASKEALDAPGIGNLADEAGLSVKELHALVREFCANT